MVSHTLYIEKVFETPEQLKQGLMYNYNPLTPSTCALFILETPSEASIWMKNTPRPLDIIFIREDLTVAKIHEGAIPYDTTHIHSGEPVKFFVETLTGFCRAFDIKHGDRVTFQSADRAQ